MAPCRFPFSFYLGLLSVSLVLLLGFAGTSDAQESVKVSRADGAQTPLQVYRPTSSNSGAQRCAPLALISPGAGGTENGYVYLARGLRRGGWLAIVMGHAESGPGTLVREVWHSGMQEGLMEMVTDPTLHRDRMMDLAATLAWAEKQCQQQISGELKVDHAPVKVLLGHSMGSDTVMFEAGASNKLGVHGEDRFDAYVAISPSGPGSIFPEHAWSNIRKPLYVLTGTRDKGLEGPWEWRERPYDDLPPGCKWLGVIDGATHLNFAGLGLAGKTKKLTLDTITAFLNGARNGDCVAPRAEYGMDLKGK